jgi:hypothetical protein
MKDALRVAKGTVWQATRIAFPMNVCTYYGTTANTKKERARLPSRLKLSLLIFLEPVQKRWLVCNPSSPWIFILSMFSTRYLVFVSRFKPSFRLGGRDLQWQSWWASWRILEISKRRDLALPLRCQFSSNQS